MSLFTATLLPGFFLILIGALLVASNSVITSTLKALPRSPLASALFFGGGALWFLAIVWRLSEADRVVFQTNTPFVIFFGVLAVAAFYFIPEFLAVRGVCVLMLLSAWELLRAAFGEYEYPQRLFMVAAVYLGVFLALYLAAVPYRMRDFFQWLFQRLPRARVCGAALLVYGVLLVAVAFTY